MKKPELLAPAGNFVCAETAFNHGADAIYIGIGQFNLRAHSPNFSYKDLPELMTLSKSSGKKVYATLNIMPDQQTIPSIRELLLQIKKTGNSPDAFIISDPGVLLLCKEILPNVDLHLSTQTGTFNLLSIDFWKQQGITRAVLPREFTINQIKQISDAKIMETEIFIHGAMCVSISGRCLLGAYTAGRHPNNGDCPQPCRWKYRINLLNDKDEPETWFDAEEDNKGVYLLNSKDLCTIGIIPKIIDTGVDSLKIEGRNKSEHYVASVVKTYRAAIDSYLKNKENFKILPEWKKELDALEHRDYTEGFYNGEYVLQDVFSSKFSGSSRIMGIVKALLPGGLPVIDVKNSFSIGELLEVVPVVQSMQPFSTTFSKITDLSGNTVERAPSNRIFVGYTDCNLRIGDMLRKASS